MENSENDPHTEADGACFSMVAGGGDRGVARMVNSRRAWTYKMNHKKRGVALIFSHKTFESSLKLDSRPTADVDRQNLHRALEQLNFKVKPFNDLSYNSIRKQIKAVATADHTDNDCILIAILTHGTNQCLYARDTTYKLDSIWQEFTSDKCPSLANKPKLFIIEAERGNRRDAGVQLRPSRSIETDSDSNSSYTLPINADFLFAYSTMQDYVSYSDSVTGSWFIQSLCAELETKGKSMDILRIMTYVTQRVAIFETYDDQQKQIPGILSTLTRILHFGNSSELINVI